MQNNLSTTEQQNPNTLNIDEKSTFEILETINKEDQIVPQAVSLILPQLAKAIDCIYNVLSKGGRLIYIGAGTSGRMGILDASECPPTFGVPPTLIQGVIAGGPIALTHAVEGAEDSKDMGKDDLIKIKLDSHDVVCGIATSGQTPYVIGGLCYAGLTGCPTVSISCVKNSEVSKYSDYPIECIVGPEVITGSTRMKAGTATKLILNMITTTVMIKMGKIYGNLMIDVQPTNNKLKKRALRVVKEVTGIEDDKKVEDLLNECNYNVKIAILKELTGKTIKECEEELEKNKGHVRKTIKSFMKK
jgi:N-acetylmuramic acid 6-phosphate etherase